VVEPARVEEVADGDPEAAALANATAKAREVAPRHPDARVLGADTVVALSGRILPKPASVEQAAEWLLALSGRGHRVVGGVCVAEAGGERAATAVTEVEFRELSQRDVARYLESGEWRERAGGYAIQGRGAGLVRGIRGDYLNVVGLPVAILLDLVPDLLA
jgi:septum formation protein